MASINFNSADVSEDEGGGGFTPIPAGWYVGRITESELKQNKKGNGSYLQFVIELDSPEVRNRLLWARHTWEHQTSPVAVEIGHREVANLCNALGRPQIADTQELHGTQFRVKVSLKDDPTYGPTNDVVGYKAVGSAPKAAPAAAEVAVTPINDDDIPF